MWWALPRLKTDGLAFLLYLGLYSFGRFFLSYLRVNNILFLGLREAQLIAVGVFIAVFPVGWWLHRRQQGRQTATSAARRAARDAGAVLSHVALVRPSSTG